TLSRIIFGRIGSVLTSLLLGILSMGFIGVLLRQFGIGINATFPGIPVWAAIVGFTFCVTFTAIYGFKGLESISYITAPSLWILVSVALYLTARESGGLGAIFEIQPENPIPFATAMGAAIATWITGAALASDITRYAKKPSHVVIGSLVGFIAGVALFEGASVLSAIGIGNPNVVSVLQSLGLIIPGLIVLGFALWNTSDNNIYSSALAFTNVGSILNLKVNKAVWVLITAAIALFTALTGVVAQFLSWLQLIGTFVPPFAGILIAHFWILHRGKSDFHTPAKMRYSPFLAWAISIIIARYSTFEIPAIVGVISAVIIYPILAKLLDRKEPAANADVATVIE
ncbi:cytosine permease, partial [Neobacillus niacini]|uniref:cytosine permease n=1 Tax=Neobacillus niacini TaxID=86668 RepID=UPI0030038BE1